MNWAALGVLTIEWVLFGYSLTFGPGTPGIGSWKWGGLRYVGGDPNPDYCSTIPHILFAMFQVRFHLAMSNTWCFRSGLDQFLTWIP